MKLFGGFLKCGTPKWIASDGNPLKIDDLGYPHFRKPSFCQNFEVHDSGGKISGFGLVAWLRPLRRMMSGLSDAGGRGSFASTV